MAKVPSVLGCGKPTPPEERDALGFYPDILQLGGMGWSSIIDQERVVGSLRSAIQSDRVAHAYLFHGPDGVGKRAVALEFAKTLLCESGGDSPCGKCSACHKTGHGVHADLHFLMPQPKDVATDEVAKRTQLAFEDPYAVVDFARRPSLEDPDKTSNKQAGYHIDRVYSDLYRPMSFKPVEGRYKIAIITDVDLFNKTSANAFLKLLEEPAPQTVFILTTERTERVLPTILSRCQRIRFSLLPAERIAGRLVDGDVADEARAEIIARMADGSYSRALSLASNVDLMAQRQAVISLFRLIWKARSGNPSELDTLADVAAETSASGRERVKNFLFLVLSWLRDILLYRNVGATDVLVNVDEAQAIIKFVNGVPRADVESMIEVVEEAIELIQRNVHLGVLMLTLFNELRRCIRGERSHGLYRPLVAVDAMPVGA
ncbi:MAG: DNA polymerase III subunit delta' [Rhodothermia bacterium]|nr:DNA polymerase III subunit delta' [Rhodothermia bacterium]